jgi:hypothetical protein
MTASELAGWLLRHPDAQVVIVDLSTRLRFDPMPRWPVVQPDHEGLVQLWVRQQDDDSNIAWCE